MRNYKNHEIRKILRSNGYYAIRHKGSHEIWYHDQKKDQIVITINSSGLNGAIGRKIISDHKLVV